MPGKNYIWNQSKDFSCLTILNPRTKTIRRSMYKSPGFRQYLHLKYDKDNRLTRYFFMEKWRDKQIPLSKEYLKASYDKDGQLQEYEDSYGNCWKKDWQVPFLHEYNKEYLEYRARVQKYDNPRIHAGIRVVHQKEQGGIREVPKQVQGGEAFYMNSVTMTLGGGNKI